MTRSEANTQMHRSKCKGDQWPQGLYSFPRWHLTGCCVLKPTLVSTRSKSASNINSTVALSWPRPQDRHKLKRWPKRITGPQIMKFLFRRQCGTLEANYWRAKTTSKSLSPRQWLFIVQERSILKEPRGHTCNHSKTQSDLDSTSKSRKRLDLHKSKWNIRKLKLVWLTLATVAPMWMIMLAYSRHQVNSRETTSTTKVFWCQEKWTWASMESWNQERLCFKVSSRSNNGSITRTNSISISRQLAYKTRSNFQWQQLKQRRSRLWILGRRICSGTLQLVDRQTTSLATP